MSHHQAAICIKMVTRRTYSSLLGLESPDHLVYLQSSRALLRDNDHTPWFWNVHSRPSQMRMGRER